MGRVMDVLVALLLRPTAGLTLQVWLVAAGVTLLVMLGAARWLRRRDDPRVRVRLLAAGGTSISGIARRLGLAQDAVRDLLGPEAVPVRAPGTFPRPGGAQAARRRFSDFLYEVDA